MSLRDTLPERSALEAALELEVADASGANVKFGSIFAEQKTVVVFIRHFFCGSCQSYVQHLASVPDAALESAGTKIVLIGCGQWQALKYYAETTGFRGAIYAESTLQLYRALGMDLQNTALTPSGQKKANYVTRGLLSNVWHSIKTGPIKAPSLIGKQGNASQLGGDFIFGPGDQCTFAHRMQHTEDHIEAADLMKAAGVTLT
ncbi:AhpC/TSA antioxidant enzyme-domain-containing protein [Mycena belliarum]|uniref:AhpC/TSA antioxidant enzyme-domain-containing protein n=1 Tax=Mycena belliarum TaxID=1033014 RepID=A0AAD6XS83_9AGAR|nr:AhpC/TSA antioxidant enzyme-domain-containing protein [Mycena belliae]